MGYLDHEVDLSIVQCHTQCKFLHFLQFGDGLADVKGPNWTSIYILDEGILHVYREMKS